MGYNISHVETPVLNAWMRAGDVVALLNVDIGRPDGCFLDDISEAAIGASDPDARIILANFWWHGEWSGHSYQHLIERVAPKIIGEVQAIFYWEGGDSVSGLAVKDGQVAVCEVERRLVLPEGW